VQREVLGQCVSANIYRNGCRNGHNPLRVSSSSKNPLYLRISCYPALSTAYPLCQNLTKGALAGCSLATFQRFEVTTPDWRPRITQTGFRAPPVTLRVLAAASCNGAPTHAWVRRRPRPYSTGSLTTGPRPYPHLGMTTAQEDGPDPTHLGYDDGAPTLPTPGYDDGPSFTAPLPTHGYEDGPAPIHTWV